MILKIEAVKDFKNYIAITKANGSEPAIEGMGDMGDWEDILLKHMCEISDEIGEK